MMTSQEIVSLYEGMSDLTAQMLQAASKGEWDLMVELEQQCAACVRMLQASEPPAPLVGEPRSRKVEAIRKMLDDDRRIRDLTTPWMARLSALINNTGAERRLASAYGP